MTTQEFMRKHVALIDAGNVSGHATCASVMRDGDVIYSYGYHYPLLIKMTTASGRPVWLCNDGGYSATTSKHIAWARPFADVCAPVGGRGGFFSQKLDRDVAIKALQGHIAHIQERMESKAKKDTRVYRDLSLQLQKAQNDLAILNT